MMFLVLDQRIQKRRGFLRRNRGRCKRWIGGQPDESRLSDGATGPAVTRLRREPVMRCGVMLVVRPGEGQQYVRIEEGNLHDLSLAKISRARSPGITGASTGTRNT